MSLPLQQLIPVAGALFLTTPDPLAAIPAVENSLHLGVPQDSVSSLEGVPQRILTEYAGLLPRDAQKLSMVLTCGASWALGMRAAPQETGRWRPVVSGAGLGPPDFRHRTGETLIQLIMSARYTLRFAPAYFDEAAARYLGPSIAGATKRGVRVGLLIVRQLEKGEAADQLRLCVDELGVEEQLCVQRAAASQWLAHMKVLSVDGQAAYIGSANSTLQGLSTNFELGAVVEGPAVATIDAFLDRIEAIAERAGAPDHEPKP